VSVMKVFKKYIKKAIATTSGRTGKWDKTSKMKVLIKCFDGFEKERWEKMIEQEYPMLLNKTDFRIVESKLEFLKFIGNAEAVFSDDIEDIQLAHKALFYQIPLTGVDYIERYASSNVIIVTSRGLASRSVAEYVLGYLLFHAKQIANTLIDRTKRQWSQEHYFNTLQMLNSVNVCIMGYGAIGQEIASILEIFHTNLFIVDIKFDKSHTLSRGSTYYKSFEEVQAPLDYIIITLPLNKSTKHIINGKYFEKIGSHCILINISRGEVINEKDLIYALKNHQIAGAVIDVVTKEPLTNTSVLWDCPNLIVTPHISGNIYIIREKIMKRFLDNVSNARKRETLVGRITF